MSALTEHEQLSTGYHEQLTRTGHAFGRRPGLVAMTCDKSLLAHPIEDQPGEREAQCSSS